MHMRRSEEAQSVQFTSYVQEFIIYNDDVKVYIKVT